MGYRNLRQCLDDLERTNQLIRVREEVDPMLEAAEIQRRVFAGGGPALLFERVRGSTLTMASNIFGTLARARFLFRDTLPIVEAVMAAKADPATALAKPANWLKFARAGLSLPPRFVSSGPVQQATIRIGDLPRQVSWPKDGGPFITLPQVLTEDPHHPGWRSSNLGMYRVQLSGNRYRADQEVGMHYQIHRGIGVHHTAARALGQPLRVSISIGGPPALAVAAVMPLPEGMPEMVFANLLAGHRIRWIRRERALPMPAEAEVVIEGHIDPERLLPEGPFGDHLGYYSLAHEYPVLTVERVVARRGAIWPFTVVGRPPQEDTTFGELIHELTGPVIPTVIHGVRAVHAVDAAGVHPLLLAIGSERYTPYVERERPQELLTQANALLGQGQLSLAKYLWIAAGEDDPSLDVHDVGRFFRHILERVDWRQDLHFQTETTIDTLDYSGQGVNRGSKLVIAAVGPGRRQLATELRNPRALPEGFSAPRIVLPGVLAITGPPVRDESDELERLCQAPAAIDGFPLWVVADDSAFVAESLRNFLWVVFTRSDPAQDVHGFGAFVRHKHWGCDGSLVIDARIKPRHAPVLEPDPEVTKKVDRLGAPGGPLHGII